MHTSYTHFHDGGLPYAYSKATIMKMSARSLTERMKAKEYTSFTFPSLLMWSIIACHNRLFNQILVKLCAALLSNTRW